MLNLNRQITSYSIILLNSIKLLSSIISKQYNILFALTLNCHHSYRTFVMASYVFVLFDDWRIWFCFNIPWRNRSTDLQGGSFVWILFRALYWKKYCNLHWSFLSLFDRIFFVGTSFIFKLLLFFFSGVCSIIDFQRYRLILCNIEGQSEFSKNANSSIHGNIKKMFEPTFLQLYFLIEYCFWPCNIVILCFKLLATLIYLKPKMHNVAAIGSANWLYSPLCIVLPK